MIKRLPDWLNPWWSETREVRTPLDEQSARTTITNASGFLKGSLGRVLFARSLTVFHESWWHLRRPWAIARVSVMPANPGSIVTLHVSRSWFHAAFITLFAIFALGLPLVFFGFAYLVVAMGQPAPTPWWSYPAWEAQDAAIYAAVMALNSGAVRRDTRWLTQRITDLVNSTPVGSAWVEKV